MGETFHWKAKAHQKVYNHHSKADNNEDFTTSETLHGKAYEL